MKEMEVLKKLKHANIIQIIEFGRAIYKTADKEEERTYIALEVAEEADLYDWVNDTGEFSDELCRFYFL